MPDKKETNKDKKDIDILGIETSCDDTCASVVRNGNEVLSNIVSSQNEIHGKYGGIVPEIASRKHIEMIDIVINEALLKAGVSSSQISAVSVTNRPGLLGSLLVGVGAAKAFSYFKNIPFIAINHLKAHIYANILASPEIKGRAVSLIVSGGHSSLYLLDESFKIKEIGHTVDDAIGEAFDKIARYIGLGYPGGPIIDKLAKKGDPEFINFTRPMTHSGDYNFSFSGIKTALIYMTKKNPDLIKEENLAHLAASFQAAAVDVLVLKTIKAAKEFKVDKILVSGGVAANTRLRQEFNRAGKENNISIYIPPVFLCTDNAAMVAALGHERFKRKEFSDLETDVFSRTDF